MLLRYSVVKEHEIRRILHLVPHPVAQRTRPQQTSLCLRLRSGATPVMGSHVLCLPAPFRHVAYSSSLRVAQVRYILNGLRLPHQPPINVSPRNRQHRRPPILKPRNRPARASRRIVASLHNARAAAPFTSSHGVPESRSGISLVTRYRLSKHVLRHLQLHFSLSTALKGTPERSSH